MAQGTSLVLARELRLLAARWGCSDKARLNLVCRDLAEGADIGCEGHFRAASYSSNTASSYKFGQQVTDEIADWVTKGFAAGPIEEGDLPGGAKINSILCREKPNGAVRVILNLSAPEGLSVNDGIDAGRFPATMSSTEKWLTVLNKAGRCGVMTKIDWAAAYKHVAVRQQDMNLQWFQWLGKFFVEKCLVFGGASSAGIYDRLAKTVLDIVIRASGFPKDMVCQHLDDVCAAAPAGTELAENFDRMYAKVASQVGVQLAPRDDPDKSFSSSTTGVVFGVRYDTVAWTWGIPEEKMGKFGDQVRRILAEAEVRQDEIQSVVGRIINVKALVSGGRFNMDHLMRLQNLSERGGDLIQLNDQFKRQLYTWLVLLMACSGRAAIPGGEERLPPWAMDCFTDAAGGSLESAGRGLGAVIPELGWWAYMPWARLVNSGAVVYEGKKVSRKLSALELMGPLLVLAAAAEEVQGRAVRFWVDNSGSCIIWKKGYSIQCKLASTVVKAIADIAAALGCRIDIVKVARCSSAGTEAADAISKANFRAFRSCFGQDQFREGPAAIPRALLAWAVSPYEDDNLGRKILEEIAVKTIVLGMNC